MRTKFIREVYKNEDAIHKAETHTCIKLPECSNIVIDETSGQATVSFPAKQVDENTIAVLRNGYEFNDVALEEALHQLSMISTMQRIREMNV